MSKQQNRQNKSLSEVQLQKERHSQAEEAKEESAEIERVLAESKLLARIEALERKEAVRKDYKKSLEHQNKFRADKIKLVKDHLCVHLLADSQNLIHLDWGVLHGTACIGHAHFCFKQNI